MIKLQDFARDCGVTDRAIQKHLKNHEKELEGHFQRRGKNGTWLDDTACELIRSLMVQKPIVVGDAAQLRENEALKEENSKLKDQVIAIQYELIEAQKALAAAEEGKRLLEGVAEEKEELKINLKAAEEELEQFKPTWFGFYKKAKKD